jgi:hypothetical protein
MTIIENERYIIDKYNLKPIKLMTITHDNDEAPVESKCICILDMGMCNCDKD